jgi:tetratricopeptide (TPR) repeat protein
MAQLIYRNIDIEIGTVQTAGYPVAILNSPGGQTRGFLALPNDLDQFERELAELDAAMFDDPTAGAVALAQRVGAQLFDALLPGELRSMYDVARSVTREAGEGLRIKLRVNAPELATLPWEFLFDQRRGAFVALSRYTPVVRYAEVAAPDRPLAVTPPLRVLGVAASPDGVEPLDIAEEQRRVEAAFAPLVEQGQLELTWLTPPTWRALQAALQAGPWHVLHFVGHAELNGENGEPVVILADDGGEALRLSAGQLADLLADQRTLRLAVLNACEGARGHDDSVFSSMAATLVLRGLPAVVAMQYAITDDAAVEFSASFYAALANLYSVDGALAEARKAMSLAEPNSLEWATPVLHMRAPDGAIFTADEEEEEKGAGKPGNIINIGAIGGAATVIGGDAQNVAVGQGNVISAGPTPSANEEAGEADPEASDAASVPAKGGWLARLFGRDHDQTSDARLIIGGNARNVIVGSRNVQVNVGNRNVTVPIFVIAGALVLLLALLVYPLVEPLWNPGQMQGQFNIAITQFGESDADGRVRETDDSRTLSTWLYDQLNTVYAETPDVPLSDSVEIWHDTRTDTAQNVALRAIRGNTPAAREENARKLAERIGAHMVIYGYLVDGDESSGLDLEFYLAPTVNDETAVIVGPHRLGRPVSVPLPFDADDPITNVVVTERLRTRAEALFWLTVGLTQEVLGRNKDALTTFRRAEAALADWTPEEGRELLYFFIGREELFLENDEAAEAAFQEAIALNPDYARAYNGLGSAHFLRAQRVEPAERLVEPSDLAAAITNYEEALVLARAQDNVQIEHLALLSLGTAYRLEGESHYIRSEFEPALTAFARAEDHLTQAYFADGANYRLSAQGYQSLGLAHFQRADVLRQQGDAAGRLLELEAARTAFADCVAQAEAGSFDDLLRIRIVDQSCRPLHQATDDALADLAKES